MTKIWIELPLFDNDGGNEKTAAQANQMLNKLGVEGKTFFWSRAGQYYGRIIDEAGSFKELADHGDWFNLDFLSK